MKVSIVLTDVNNELTEDLSELGVLFGVDTFDGHG